MTRQFTVIQGGLSGALVPETLRADWRVELRRPGNVDAAAIAAWRSLTARGGVSDPDHLSPLARQRPAGRRVALALAWNRDAAGGETLQGVVPLAMPHPVRGRSAETRRPVRLSSSPDAPRRPIPAAAFVGVRIEGWEAAADAEAASVGEPAEIRDAVESTLALDARSAKQPIVADPSKASPVRVASRLFAGRRASRVEFFRRAGEIVAGTLHLGAGAAAVAWRRP